MNTPAPWLLVFDLDGTLIDSSLDLCLSVNAAMAHIGASELPHQRITRFIGDGAAMLVRRALQDSRSADTSPPMAAEQDEVFKRAFAFFLSYYREHKLDHTRLYPGVLPSLQKLRSRYPELPMAVLTNKPVRPSREICDALGLTPFFFANYGGDSFASKKPDPVGLKTLMHEATQRWQHKGVNTTSLHGAGVVMIGDSEADILTGRRAQTLTLGCRYGLAPESLERARPDLLCEHPEEWSVLLAQHYEAL